MIFNILDVKEISRDIVRNRLRHKRQRLIGFSVGRAIVTSAPSASVLSRASSPARTPSRR